MDPQIISYTRTGAAHRLSGVENQDACLSVKTDRFLFAAVADGVSACKNSKEGAVAACSLAADICETETDYLFSLSEKKLAGVLLGYIRDSLARLAAEKGEEAASYASTLSFLCTDRETDRALLFSLGDGMVRCLGRDGGAVLPVCPPPSQGGPCCATMTAHAEEQTRVAFLPAGTLSDVFLCSDGVWKTLGADSWELPPEELCRRLEEADPADDCTFMLCSLHKPRGRERKTI